MTKILPAFCAALLAVALAPVRAQDDAVSTQLRKRRHELRLQLLKERAALLKTDADAKALHRRIQRLHEQLEELLSKKPVIQKLEKELQAVEDRLQERLPQPPAQPPKKNPQEARPGDH